MNRWIAVASLSIVCAAVVSCNPLAPMACTLIGCNSGLRVELEGTPTAPFTLTAASDEATETIVCEQTAGCFLFFEDFTPSQVTISYESGGDQVVQSFHPSYTRSRPNGDGCPPECVNATVVLQLPEG